MVVVVLFVLHLQLAHVELRRRNQKDCIRASVGASVRVRSSVERVLDGHLRLHRSVAVPGRVGNLRPAACMHA